MSKVYLVGAGPGDPELLTLKGRRVLESADSVLYDHLASPALLDLAPDRAERLYVGKKRSSHVFTQDEIISLMVDRARSGLSVVRLKGGDPFIFGRGGEEVEGLVDAGVEFEVIPGVTSPLGIAAYVGIPLTHREHSSVVTFITGHEPGQIDWSRTGLHGTVVVFMGLQHFAEIAERMIAAGRPSHTPAVAVRWGTRSDQQTVTGTLTNLARLTQDAHLAPPVTFIVGEVVALQERLGWFDRRPLSGQRVIVTRPRAQSEELAAGLRDRGAAVIELPVIELAPLADYTALDGSIRKLGEYDWLVFTSANAVEYFRTRLTAAGRDARAIRGRICAIGPATSDALTSMGLSADVMPDESDSEGVAVTFSRVAMNGARVLIPRAAAAREFIPSALERLGANVEAVDAYRNIIPSSAQSRVLEYLAGGHRADWITFTSGSTIKNWLTLAGRESLDRVRIASIGPATSDVIRQHDLTVDVEADPHTGAGLIDAILKACRNTEGR